MSNSHEHGTPNASVPDYAAIEHWLRSTVAELLGRSDSEVDVHSRFARFGIDSAAALIITDMLSEWLGLELDATLLYEHATIQQLARHLAAQVAARAPAEGRQ
jgi:acyl carrier protein